MLQIRRIIQLLEQGQSKRKIALSLHSGRHTIDGYIHRIEQSGLELQQLSKLSDADLGALLYTGNREQEPDRRLEDLQSRFSYFHSELCRTGVTKLTLWQEYRLVVPDGYSYSQFCEHLVNDKRKSSATMHFEHKPAERVQVDFAGKKLSYVDISTSEIITCPVLVCVLPFSGYSYIEALPYATQEYLYPALGRCMSYFGGVPANVLSDNMKQYVKKSNRYEPVFSEVCEQWSLYYNTSLSATRVAKPKDKPSVEQAVHLAYMRVYAPLRNKIFYSLKELNDNIIKCLDIHHNKHLQNRTYNRRELFEQHELPLLKALPAEPFVLKHTVVAKVQKNYHIILGEDWHQYSVPYQHIGKKVKIIYDADEVEVYLDLRRIAVHRRNYRKHGYTTLEEHMPEKHKKYRQTKGWDADYFLGKAKQLGVCSHKIMSRILESKTFTEQAYNACLGLLRLSGQYGEDRFENACKRAVNAPRVNYRLISDILSNNLDKEQTDQMTIFSSIPDHENIRGPQAYN